MKSKPTTIPAATEPAYSIRILNNGDVIKQKLKVFQCYVLYLMKGEEPKLQGFLYPGLQINVQKAITGNIIFEAFFSTKRMRVHFWENHGFRGDLYVKSTPMLGGKHKNLCDHLKFVPKKFSKKVEIFFKFF